MNVHNTKQIYPAGWENDKYRCHYQMISQLEEAIVQILGTKLNLPPKTQRLVSHTYAVLSHTTWYWHALCGLVCAYTLAHNAPTSLCAFVEKCSYIKVANMTKGWDYIVATSATDIFRQGWMMVVHPSQWVNAHHRVILNKYDAKAKNATEPKECAQEYTQRVSFTCWKHSVFLALYTNAYILSRY